ncbi:MAG: hypothetical protein PHW14_03465 [Candidatus Omnitrophica bacterium]|nr:hypothetical protein [Candidatus Omnitrophota bacterium]
MKDLKEEKMKRALSVFAVMVFAAGMAFAAEGADKSMTPVGSAATEVTKEAAGVVTTGMERRQDRRGERREALFGTKEAKPEAAKAGK